MKFLHCITVILFSLCGPLPAIAQQRAVEPPPAARTVNPPAVLPATPLVVAPLLPTRWDEGCFCNASCPPDTAAHTTCLHVPAGSGAVAMAQVMKYHQYPAHGTGEHGYQHPVYGIQYANFGVTNYFWQTMPDSVIAPQEGIATMIYQCGVAQDMFYGSSVSSSSRIALDTALVKYFGYGNQASWQAKQDFTPSAWLELIRGELVAGRPVILSGSNSQGTKQRFFVCDGFQGNDLLHINWGLGGDFDGYYSPGNLLLDTVNYSFQQYALVNLAPPLSGNITMDFENVPDFALTFDNWTTRDLDLQSTYGIENHAFPHQTEPMAFLCFNPAQVVPSMATDQAIQPHGGQRFGACFSSNPPANNDWFISPQVQIGLNGSFSFWVKSYSALYGLDKYTVAVSVTDNNPGSFTVISGSEPLEATLNWTKKTFNLSGYHNQKVYLAIHCVSNDNFLMMIDDLEIKPTATPGVTADFTADKTSLRVGETVAFSDQSTGGPTSWAWSFPGGSPAASTLQNPSGIRYNTPGLYPVSLKVSLGATADSITRPGFINVTGYPSSVTLDFESYPNFVVAMPPWTLTDVKGGKTYGIEGVYFPNNYSAMAYICFNPSMTTPAMVNMQAHAGQKLGCSFSSTPPMNPNDKWLISPKLSLGINPQMECWVRTYNNQFGDEKFNVAVSTTNAEPASFTPLTAQPESAPMTWTRKTYDLGSYANQDVYVGIQCVTNDGFIFMIDDISITSTLGANELARLEPVIFPNPAQDFITIRFFQPLTAPAAVALVTMQGENLLTVAMDPGIPEVTLGLSQFPAGIYLLRITSGTMVVTKKITILK